MPGGSPWPRISVVTPSYNQGQFIEETIRSILLQGYPDLEYIIIDGGSSDNSVEIIRKHERWLKYWVSEPDDGQAAALNKGFRYSSGDIHYYLNSDDILCSDSISIVVSMIGKNAKIPFLISFPGKGIYENGSANYFKPESIQHPAAWLNSEYSLFQPSTFWTRVLHDQVGHFDEEMRFCFDKDFFFRCIFIYGKYKCLSSPHVSVFRMHGTSKTNLLPHVMQTENQFIRNRYINDPRMAKAYKFESAHNFIVKSLVISNFMDRVRFLSNAVKISPSVLGTRFFWGAINRLRGTKH